MKFIIKNLKQVTYEVEVDNDEESVLTLKKRIEDKHGFNHETFKLVYNQKILDNEKLLKEYNLQDGNVIIMMNSTVKPKPKEPEPVKQPDTTKSDGAKPTTTTHPTQPTQQTQPHTTTQPTQPQQEKNYDKEIAELVDMGFSRDDSKACIKAARGNLSLAVEFLENGIPDNLPEDIPSSGGNVGNIGAGGDRQTQINALIKSIASVVKVISQNDESQLENILQSIEQNDPNLFALIAQNQNEFRRLLTEPVTDEDLRVFQEFTQRSTLGGRGLGGLSGQSGQGSQGPRAQGGRIAVTREEMEAINRLKSFGFNDLEAAQAYFACDKNEDLAINFLFDNKARETGDDINIDYSQFTDVNPNQGSGNQGGSSETEKKKDEDKKDENK